MAVLKMTFLTETDTVAVVGMRLLFSCSRFVTMWAMREKGELGKLGKNSVLLECPQIFAKLFRINNFMAACICKCSDCEGTGSQI